MVRPFMLACIDEGRLSCCIGRWCLMTSCARRSQRLRGSRVSGRSGGGIARGACGCGGSAPRRGLSRGRCLHSKLLNECMRLMAICARHLQMLRQSLSQRLHGRPHCARHMQWRRDHCAQRPQSCASR